MTDNLFDSADRAEIDLNKNYLDELVGEGKKFKDAESLAKGKAHSDAMIEILKREKDQIAEDYRKAREENVAKAKLEDLIDQLKNQPNLNNPEHTQGKEDEKSAYNPEQMRVEAVKAIQELRNSEKQSENFNLVQEKLKERFGDNFPAALKSQIKTLGLTPESVNEMAKNNPIVLIKALGLDSETSNSDNMFQTPPSSTQRVTTDFSPKGEEKRFWSYWQKVKKDNPNWYLDRTLTNQMTNDAVKWGEAFKDGDYYLKGVHEH